MASVILLFQVFKIKLIKTCVGAISRLLEVIKLIQSLFNEKAKEFKKVFSHKTFLHFRSLIRDL